MLFTMCEELVSALIKVAYWDSILSCLLKRGYMFLEESNRYPAQFKDVVCSFYMSVLADRSFSYTLRHFCLQLFEKHLVLQLSSVSMQFYKVETSTREYINERRIRSFKSPFSSHQ